MLISTAFAADRGIANEARESFFEFFKEMIFSLPFWVLAGIVFWISFYAANFFKKMVSSRIVARAKGEVHEEILILVERVVSTGIVILGGVIALKIVKIDAGLLIGFLGIGIGFAFKDLLANFIAGVVILTQNKYKIGDLVQVKDRIGTIVEIEPRTTQIRSIDGILLVVPNSEMLTEVVHNFTANSFRRIIFQVGVHYSTPLKKATEIMMNTMLKHEMILNEPSPQVIVTEFGDSAIILEARFWVESKVRGGWWTVKSDVMQNLKKEFDNSNIQIPFPIRTLEFGSDAEKILKSK